MGARPRKWKKNDSLSFKKVGLSKATCVGNGLKNEEKD